jgi:hypothetical protein
VADDVIAKGVNPSFRCSRCKHTFEFAPEPDAAPTPIADKPAESPGAGPELAFPFAPGERSEAAARPKPQPEPDASTEVVSPGDRATEEPTNPDREQSLSATPASSAVTPDPTVSPTAGTEDIERPSPLHEPIDKDVVVEIDRNQAASVKPFLTLFVLLVLAFAFVVAYQRMHPDTTTEWMRSLPLVGRLVVRNDLVKSGVLLKSVETKYQSLQGSREVVVLTGIAVNQNPVMIRNVQLAGQLFDKDGKEIERQTMWIGNAISPQIIRGMTAQDVSDLQRYPEIPCRSRSSSCGRESRSSTLAARCCQPRRARNGKR